MSSIGTYKPYFNVSVVNKYFHSYIRNNYVKVWNSQAEYVNLWRVHLITSLPL